MKDSKTKILMLITFVCWGVAALLTAFITLAQRSLLVTWMGVNADMVKGEFALPVSMIINLGEAIILYSIFAAISANENVKSRKTVSMIFVVVKCLSVFGLGVATRFVVTWRYRMLALNAVTVNSSLESMISLVAGSILAIANMLFFTALGAYMGSEE
ncbi:MAG: hypothetical protein IJ833_07075 [Lachnospiraceae bacterium]|nr:hypothetical protein [Lachnospiraceae bacterium]